MFVGVTLVCLIGKELCMFGLTTADGGFLMALSLQSPNPRESGNTVHE